MFIKSTFCDIFRLKVCIENHFLYDDSQYHVKKWHSLMHVHQKMYILTNWAFSENKKSLKNEEKNSNNMLDFYDSSHIDIFVRIIQKEISSFLTLFVWFVKALRLLVNNVL